MSLIKLALLKKQAGPLQMAGEQLTNLFLRKGLKGTANIIQKPITQVAQEGVGTLGSKLKNLVAPTKQTIPIIPKRALRNESGALVQNLI